MFISGVSYLDVPTVPESSAVLEVILHIKDGCPLITFSWSDLWLVLIMITVGGSFHRQAPCCILGVCLVKCIIPYSYQVVDGYQSRFDLRDRDRYHTLDMTVTMAVDDCTLIAGTCFNKHWRL
jgi:hypothetical protein